MGPIPNHFAFIMDGNRRYAKKENMKEGAGHRAGFVALISVLRFCYELGVKYVTIYAFSMDNFKRSPDEVKHLMDLMLEKIELPRDESIVNQYGISIFYRAVSDHTFYVIMVYLPLYSSGSWGEILEFKLSDTLSMDHVMQELQLEACLLDELIYYEPYKESVMLEETHSTYMVRTKRICDA
ncbi:hypothetical protein GH714_032801 [Hevea brasiliensis]|uniref:Alkyl transferase n=1 Tax=Hevea brasiliensis TaxID=3981 RepID=A0A6A6LXW0_HEVBR|nr:hypothetical protein GH714_032801 [Hevea brasiliensis]